MYASAAFFEPGAPDVAPNTKHHDLAETHGFRIDHSKCRDPLKIRGEDVGTVGHLLERDNEHQNAVLYQPMMRVFEKQPFQAAVTAQVDLGIVRRI